MAKKPWSPSPGKHERPAEEWARLLKEPYQKKLLNEPYLRKGKPENGEEINTSKSDSGKVS